MSTVNAPINRFDGGILGDQLHNRVDIPTYANSAAEMVNFRADVQGTMTRRPSMFYVADVDVTTDYFGQDVVNGEAEIWPFYYSINESYLVLAKESGLRFFDTDDDEVRIPEVSVLIGPYTDESAAPASLNASGDSLFLDSDGGEPAIAQYPIGIGESGVLHVVEFEILHGPIDVYIGSAQGDDDLMRFSRLRAGHHCLAFTPSSTGTVYLRFENRDNAGRMINRNSVRVMSGPEFTVPTPYLAGDLKSVHFDQIRDVLYLTHVDYWVRRLERRGPHSWSMVRLMPEDGPFGDTNSTNTTLRVQRRSGEVMMYASDAFFSERDEGVLYELTHPGQTVSETANAAGVATEGIKVTGIGNARRFNVYLDGTFSADVTLQRSSGNENNYTDFVYYDSVTSETVSDDLDNQTWYYRLIVKAGDFTSGSVGMTLIYGGGSQTGVVRVVQHINSTQVTAEVLDTVADVGETTTWRRGAWNNDDGHPSSITTGFGRLWLARGSNVWSSNSDDFTSFKDGEEADEGINATIAAASSDSIQWLGFLNALCIGTTSVEYLGIPNTNSEPTGPTNFQFTAPVTEEGSRRVQPVRTDGSLLFVHRSGKKLIQFTQNPQALSETSMIAIDLVARTPELLDFDEIISIAIQREPERRVYVVMSSGLAYELLFRREGGVDLVAWNRIETNGLVDRVVVLPRQNQDTVYFLTRRKNASGTDWRRYLERYGSERTRCMDDVGHLDSAVRYEMEKPDSTLTIQGVVGSVATMRATETDVFAAGNVGAEIWVNGSRGEITGVTGTDEIQVAMHWPMDHTRQAPAGSWGFRQPFTVLTGLGHLLGQQVTVWANLEEHPQLYNVEVVPGINAPDGGKVTLPNPVSVAMVGHKFESRWQSLKLAYGAEKGTAIGQPKAIEALHLLLHRTSALEFGPTFEKMWEIALRSEEINYDQPNPFYTGEKEVDFDGGFSPDSRLCLKVSGPSPATVAGVVPRLTTEER